MTSPNEPFPQHSEPEKGPCDQLWQDLVDRNPSSKRRLEEDGSNFAGLLCDLNEARELLNHDSTIGRNDGNTPALRTESVDIEAGMQIDGYTITRRLGRGGMGVVFAAWQERLGREVALKMVHLGPLADANALARSELEALTAARLNHNGIVSVHDSGTWDGYQYYAMELIDGPTLSQLLQGGPINAQEAIKFVRQICDAVQYAHQNGILHRDLKPSNVLVAPDGKARITDFGLAKLISADGESDLTRSGAMMGTPNYMSPEQALGDSKRVTVKSDVYSIGAILYELLTGRAPFQAASPVETMRQVVDQQPAPPRSLNAAVSRDLETVCLKCLDKSPELRYASPELLADDLNRIAEGRPIAARPVSALNKSLRWCRRRPALAITLALLAASLLAGTITSLAMWRNSAAHAKAAERQAAKAEAVSRFFADEVLSQANAYNSPDRDISLAAAIDAASAKLKDQFADQPLIEASIRQTLGSTYMSLGRYDESREHLNKSIDLFRAKVGETHQDTINAMFTYNSLNYLLGDYEKSYEEYRRLAEIAEPSLGPADKLTLEIKGQHGHLAYWLGRYDEAREIYESVLATQLAGGDEHFNSSLVTRNNLALLHSSSGDFPKAEPLFLENLALQRKHLGDEYPDTLTTLNNLGYLYCATKDFGKAREYYVEALDSRRRVLGNKHIDTTFSIHNMGQFYQQQGEFEQSRPYLEEALNIRVEILGDANQNTQNSRLVLAHTLIELRALALAETICQRAVEIASEHTPNRWPHHLARSHLGSVYALQEKHEQAEPLLTDAYEKLIHCEEDIPEPDRSDCIRHTAQRLIALLRATGQTQRAAELITETDQANGKP